MSITQKTITGSKITPPGVTSTPVTNVGGSVTAEAGPLALESGGNLQALVTRTGEVQATPTANTILGRLKNIWDRLTDGTQKTQVVDAAGHSVASHLNIDGDYHLGVSIDQIAYDDASNSSTANLNSGATFTGTGVSTLGVNAIQVSLKTDVNCTVYIDQSSDNSNWDIVDTFNYYYSINNFSTTVQAVSKYYRVRITNNSTGASSYFRLLSVLCPVANPLPRSLDEDGHVATAVHVIRDEYGFEVENTLSGEMRTVIPVLLVGKLFEGTTVDPNFRTVTTANGGTAAQANNDIVLATNTTANGSVKLNSVRRARYIPGQSLVCRTMVQLSNTGATNNSRKWGISWGTTMPTITDGAYFELTGTTFQVVTLKGSSATAVTSGNFNGTLGATYALDTNINTYEIYYNNSVVIFSVNGETLHTVSASTTTWSNTVQQHIYVESVNSGGATSNNSITCRSLGIRRLGSLLSQCIGKYQSGTTTGIVCKYGLGNIHGITISNITNNAVVTLYDNTAASGSVIWASGAMSNQTVPFDINFHGQPFFVGLTLVISGAACDVNIQYE